MTISVCAGYGIDTHIICQVNTLAAAGGQGHRRCHQQQGQVNSSEIRVFHNSLSPIVFIHPS